MTADEHKRRAAAAAVELVESGMTVGLGTGSTAAHFIDMLGARARGGLYIKGVPTSDETARRAMAAGIDLIEPDEASAIDLAVDGADEIDPALNLIKGGGGALLREKIVASAAKRFVVIADASKRVAALGAYPLPVEIDPFAFGLTIRRLRETLADAGFVKPSLRLRPDGQGGVFRTDGGHFVVDCSLGRIEDAAGLERALGGLAGVVETGLFVAMAHRVIVAGPQGVSATDAAGRG